MSKLKNRRFTPDLKDARKEQKEAEWASRRDEFDRQFTDARTYLLMRHHFFGRLAMRLKYVWTKQIPTMAVTADFVCYMNPDFFEKLDLGERAFLIAHEISHLGYLHFDRVGNKNQQLWNHAGDYMINAMLVKAGLKMPVLDDRWADHPHFEEMKKAAKEAGHDKMGLLDKKYADESDIQIYETLWEDMKEQMRQGGQCPECGQQQENGQQQSQSGQGGGQDSDDQDQDGQGGGSGDSDEQDDQQQDGQEQSQGGGGQDDEQQSQDGSGAGGEGDEEEQDGQEQSQGGGDGDGDEQDDQQQSQGGSGDGDQEQDGQQQSQGQQGGSGSHDSSTCNTCGQQKQQTQGGWGTAQGDMDLGATEELKQKAAKGEGEKVPTPGQIRDLLITAAQATESFGRGEVPAGMKRWIAEIRDPKLPWNHLLQRWVSSVLTSGQSYRRPARSSGGLVKAARMRGMSRGVRPILPGPKPDLQPIIVTVDTSGSRSPEDLRDDLSEVFGVLEKYHNPTRVIVWDAAVHFDDYVRSVDEIELEGGGGTRTEPVFEAVEEDPGRWGPPAAMVTFTDGMASYPEHAPPYPVLWVWTGKGDIPMEPPFGQVITIDGGLTQAGQVEDRRGRRR